MLKLTEAQARVAGMMADGVVICKGRISGNFFYEAGSGIIHLSSAMLDRMMDRGIISRSSTRTKAGNRILELTDAGRAALEEWRAKHVG